MTRFEKFYWITVATVGCVGSIGLMIALRVGNAQSVLIASLLVGIAVGLIAVSMWGTVVELILQTVWPRDAEGVDDRGNCIVLQHWQNMPTQFTLSRTEKQRIKSWTIKQRGYWRDGLLMYVYWLPAIAILIVGQFHPIPNMVGWLISILVVLPCAVIGLRQMRRFILLHFSRSLALINRCGSCGYDMANLSKEDDGCTICPECGAAWKLASESAPEGHDDMLAR